MTAQAQQTATPRKKFPTGSRGMTLEQRFWEKVDKTPGQGRWGDCWLWIGAIGNGHGYGSIGGKRGEPMRRAHVVSYEMHYGPVPNGLIVLHNCDNPPCVNPEHLWPDTHDENMRQSSLRRWLKEEVSIHSLKPSDLIIKPAEIESRTESDSLRGVIDRTLAKLKDKQKLVIIRRFGLDGEGEHTLEEVGQEMKLTRERIRQIEAIALGRLRHPAVSRELRAALAA